MPIDPGRDYVINPQRRYHHDDAQRLRVSVPHCQKSLRASPALAKLLDQLAAEPSLRGHELSKRLAPDLLDTLQQYFLLLPADCAEALADGLCTPSARTAGEALAIHELEGLQTDDVVLCHAPIATTTHGAVSVTGGGRWIRSYIASTLNPPQGLKADGGRLIDLDFDRQLDFSSLRLFDVGDICFNPLTDHATRLGQRVTYLCRRVAAHGARPLLLGGDHSLAYYSIGALADAYPRLGIIQFDAHTDLYAIGAECDHSINHANVFQWVRRMAHVETIWQVGLRDLYYQPTRHLEAVRDPKLRSLSAFEAATKGYDRLLGEIDDTLPWFISFDVDVLASADIPHTATPVLGGLSYYPLLQLFDQLFRRLNVVGLEFVELGDTPHGAHGPAVVASRLISLYLFHLRGSNPLTEYLFVPANT